MSEPPVTLVVIRNEKHLNHLVGNLRASGVKAFGASSLDGTVRLMSFLRPEVVVIDPASEECFAVLDHMDDAWRSMTLVAVAESPDAARRAHEMGIDDVIMGDDTVAVFDAVIDHLEQVSPSIGQA
jgi:hypothetical protein